MAATVAQAVPHQHGISLDRPLSPMQQSTSSAQAPPSATSHDQPLLDIKPDHFYDAEEGHGVPVFKPSLDEFRDFNLFMRSINSYGMQAGIVKIVPPREWREALPDLSERIKGIRIKNPITQHILAASEGAPAGTYRQTNVEKRRAYSLKQWKHMCESPTQQTPRPRRAERGSEAAKREIEEEGLMRKKRKVAAKKSKVEEDAEVDSVQQDDITTPNKNAPSSDYPTPATNRSSVERASSPRRSFKEESPSPAAHIPSPPDSKDVRATTPPPFRPTIANLLNSPSATESADTAISQYLYALQQLSNTIEAEANAKVRAKRKPKRKYIRRNPNDPIPEDWTDFDYRISNASEFTMERCKDLERAYWRNITYNQPMYGADLNGSLFDETTTAWNVANLDNILNKLKSELPGVNSPYLYFGMWKATFPWHVEDMDLYSINYIHFGAPKQWYSIPPPQADRFKMIMAGFFPGEAKACSEFLRHKTFLASPSLLATRAVPVYRCVQHEGEFIVTFPFGYHSGYNVGYNCAESINFALDSWIEIGKKAGACQCIGDAVTINVADMLEEEMREEAEADAARIKAEVECQSSGTATTATNTRKATTPQDAIKSEARLPPMGTFTPPSPPLSNDSTKE